MQSRVVESWSAVGILTGAAPESAASRSPMSYCSVGRWLCLRFRFAFGDNEYMSHIGLLFRHARGTLVVGVMRKGQAAPRRHFFETWNQQGRAWPQLTMAMSVAHTQTDRTIALPESVLRTILTLSIHLRGRVRAPAWHDELWILLIVSDHA